MAGWRISQCTGMAQLQPQGSAVAGPLRGEIAEAVQIGIVIEHEIAGLFGKSAGALHLADDRHGQAAVGPLPIQIDLFRCRVPGSIAKRVRHGGFDNPVFQDDATGQFEGVEQDVAGLRGVVHSRTCPPKWPRRATGAGRRGPTGRPPGG